MVRVIVLNDTETFQKYELDDACLNAAKSHNASAFLVTYGDEFVVSKVTGGELVVIYEFSFETEEQRSAVAAQVSGGGLLFKVGTDWAEAFSQINKTSVKNVYIHRHGGAGALPEPANFVQYALKFPNDVAPQASPLVTLFETVPYSQATNKPPDAVFPILAEAKQQMESLLSCRETATELTNDINYALTYSWQFSPFDASVLAQSKAALQSYILRLDDAARKCLADPLHFPGFSDPVPSVSLPEWSVPNNINFKFLLHMAGVGDHWYQGDTRGGGISSQIEGFELDFSGVYPGLGCQYMVHLAGYGDKPWISNGNFAGTRGQSTRLEGIAIRLTGPAGHLYSVWYSGKRTVGYIASVDLAPVSDGQFLGTRGQSSPLTEVEVHIVRRTSVFITEASLERMRRSQKEQEQELERARKAGALA
jgi:hypothetical protein